MINLEDLTVLNDLLPRLRSITPEQIEAASRRLSKKTSKAKEKAIGIVEVETTRALYALGGILGAEEAIARANAATAISEEDERGFQEQAALLDMLGDVVKELFWAQARLDLGFYEDMSIGIREGWELVRDERSQSQHGFLATLGGLPGLMPPPEE